MTRSRPAFACLSLTLMLLASGLAAQSAPPNGPRTVDPRWHALRGVTLVSAPGSVTENATVVLRDGVIVSVGADEEPPAGARV